MKLNDLYFIAYRDIEGEIGPWKIEVNGYSESNSYNSVLTYSSKEAAEALIKEHEDVTYGFEYKVIDFSEAVKLEIGFCV